MIRTLLVAWLLVGCTHSGALHAAAPPTAEQLYAVARVAAERGDGLRAQQYYAAALQAGFDARQVTPRLLRLYIADGQYRLAIAHILETLDERGEEGALRLLLAELYRAAELDVAAEREYQRVLDVQPNHARAHIELALLLQQVGRDAGRADAHLRAYLQLEPQGARADEARSRLLKGVP